jgi:hypothetical protein
MTIARVVVDEQDCGRRIVRHGATGKGSIERCPTRRRWGEPGGGDGAGRRVVQ